MEYMIGVDIGGTFTDCAVMDEDGNAHFAKAFSTPDDFSQGIFDAVRSVSLDWEIDENTLLKRARLFLYSTTIAENSLAQGHVAKAGLIATRGFEGTLFATRGGYGRWSGLTEDEKRNPIDTHKPRPIIPPSLISAVGERVDHNGAILKPIDRDEAERAVTTLIGAGVEAIGVSLLWSFLNPANELAVVEIAKRLGSGLFICASHEVAPIIGEYERTSTVALNASLGPVVSRYLSQLEQQLRTRGFGGSLLVMQAHGGLVPIQEATTRPVGMVESGPVSGLLGCQQLGESMGERNIISADLGGTTFKIGTARDGRVEYQREPMVMRYHYALPKLDVESLPLAGGSIVWIEPRTGVPRLGPRSAGSYPGPICYDHGGTEPTVTDVDAILGYLHPDYFLGGAAPLNLAQARQSFNDLIARPLKEELEAAAAAVYKLANNMIYDLMHKVTIQRGLDPRDFWLFSTGGTAGMHLPAVGQALGVAGIVVPHSAAVQGAFGLVTSDVVHEQLVTRPMAWPVPLATIDATFDGLVARLRQQLAGEGFAEEEIYISRAVDMRYRRQVHIITVPIEQSPEAGALTPLRSTDPDELVDRFEGLYKQRYGEESTYKEAGIEVVTFRVRGAGRMHKWLSRDGARQDAGRQPAIREERQAYIADREETMDVPGYDFASLVPGHSLAGPAIIWTPITTVVVQSRQTARMDGSRNLILTERANA